MEFEYKRDNLPLSSSLARVPDEFFRQQLVVEIRRPVEAQFSFSFFMNFLNLVESRWRPEFQIPLRQKTARSWWRHALQNFGRFQVQWNKFQMFLYSSLVIISFPFKKASSRYKKVPKWPPVTKWHMSMRFTAVLFALLHPTNEILLGQAYLFKVLLDIHPCMWSW